MEEFHSAPHEHTPTPIGAFVLQLLTGTAMRILSLALETMGSASQGQPKFCTDLLPDAPTTVWQELFLTPFSRLTTCGNHTCYEGIQGCFLRCIGGHSTTLSPATTVVLSGFQNLSLEGINSDFSGHRKLAGFLSIYLLLLFLQDITEEFSVVSSAHTLQC